MPLLEGPIIHKNGGAAKPPLQFTLYLPLLGGAYLVKCFALKTKAKIKKNEILMQNYNSCLISISLLHNGVSRNNHGLQITWGEKKRQTLI